MGFRLDTLDWAELEAASRLDSTKRRSRSGGCALGVAVIILPVRKLKLQWRHFAGVYVGASASGVTTVPVARGLGSGWGSSWGHGTSSRSAGRVTVRAPGLSEDFVGSASLRLTRRC
jgi:hypothetical protein